MIYFNSSTADTKGKTETTQKLSTEVVYVQDRKTKGKKEREITPAATQKNNKKPKLISDEPDSLSKKDDKSDLKTNSSRSSPLSVADSIITLPDSLENSADVPEKDPLADSDAEEKPEQKPMNLQSLSFDFNESSTPPPLPSFLPRRTLRKRGREASPEPVRPIVNESKKMKMKGKRQINTSLRKSIEEKKEQQVSSSDEVPAAPETKPPKKSPKKKQKGKSKKQKQKKQVKSTPKSDVIAISDDNEESEGEQAKTRSKQTSASKKDDTVEISDEDSTPKQRPKGKNSKYHIF